MARAKDLTEEALSLHTTFSGLSSLAMMHRGTGEWEAAEALLDAAAAEYHGQSPEPLAWLTLHRGIFDLDRGRHAEAMAHYREAEAILSGWWLVDEHIAEIYTLRGESISAENLYTDIVDRTGKPEFIDALAEIRLANGDPKGAAIWHALAHATFVAQLGSHPEAAAGHALGHFLDDGPAEADRALALAQANANLRPNGEALVLLARAQLANNAPEAALDSLIKAEDTGFVSADLYLALAEVLVSGGDTNGAEEALEQARAIDPTVNPILD